jgi:putative lipase involved disintegration of autophagic bodies
MQQILRIGFSLSFTGHSLGGGLANANALATGLPATIYNPAGLNDITVNPSCSLKVN